MNSPEEALTAEEIAAVIAGTDSDPRCEKVITGLRAKQGEGMTVGEFCKSVLKKLTSVKLWITIWAMVMSSWLIVTKQTEFNLPLIILLAVPLSFMGLNVFQDFIFRGRQ